MIEGFGGFQDMLEGSGGFLGFECHRGLEYFGNVEDVEALDSR